MASGFFLGGMADGMNAARELALKEDTQTSDVALRTRGLDIQQQGIGLREKELGQDLNLRTRALNIQEQGQKNAQTRDAFTFADKAVSEAMSVVAETISQGMAAGKDPAIIAKAVRPIIESTKGIAAKAGRNPDMLEAQVNALFARPTGTESAEGKGRAAAAGTIAQSTALNEAGIVPVDKEKSGLENSLRDDYTKAATDFVKIRDAKNRIDTVESTGAGDVALVFQFMKILDPGSTVREGEFANASNAAGVPSAIIAQYNKTIGGGVLDNKARREIKSQATLLYGAQERQFSKTTDQYRNIAKRQGLNPSNVIVDFNPVNVPVAPGTPPPPSGFVINPGRR